MSKSNKLKDIILDNLHEHLCHVMINYVFHRDNDLYIPHTFVTDYIREHYDYDDQSIASAWLDVVCDMIFYLESPERFTDTTGVAYYLGKRLVSKEEFEQNYTAPFRHVIYPDSYKKNMYEFYSQKELGRKQFARYFEEIVID